MRTGFHAVDGSERTGVWSAILGRARKRGARRQVLQIRGSSRLRAYVEHHLLSRVPALLPEYLASLVGSALALWALAALVAWLSSVETSYAIAVLGFLFTTQATYYKYRLSRAPDYRIPRCRCGGGTDHTETVLSSKQSTWLSGLTVLGAAYYPGFILLRESRYPVAAATIATVAVVASAYLAYVMIRKVERLCSLCTNAAAVNTLLLLSSVG
jgi:uncharacterized membrane protein